MPSRAIKRRKRLTVGTTSRTGRRLHGGTKNPKNKNARGAVGDAEMTGQPSSSIPHGEKRAYEDAEEEKYEWNYAEEEEYEDVCNFDDYEDSQAKHGGEEDLLNLQVLNERMQEVAAQQVAGDEITFPRHDVDLQDLQNVAQYNDLEEEGPVSDKVPTTGFEEDFIESESEVEPPNLESFNVATPAISSMGPPSRRPLQPDTLDDSSTLVHHSHFYNPHMTKFEIALGLWSTTVGISRTEFTGLREIMGMIDAPETKALPTSLSTLKRRLDKQLPLLDMRTKEIPLIPEQLASETATRKSKNLDPNDPASAEDPHETLHFFDPECMFKTFMASDITKTMHKGMAHWVDNPTELWHSRCWSSSVRTTSGQYAHFVDGGGPIFPSDFVYFKCGTSSCECETDKANKPHIGRVYGVGLDYRSNAIASGAIVLYIQQAFRSCELPIGLDLDRAPHVDELFLSWEEAFFVTEQNILGDQPLTVFMDYVFGEDNSKKTSRMQEFWHNPDNSSPQLFCRRQLSSVYSELDAIKLTPLCHTHPLRAELEIKQYGRDMFVNEWDLKSNGGIETVSVPLLTFIDGFGLYRNTYRFYNIPAALSARDRNRRANVLPLTLGPHGSNFEDVVAAMRVLIPLDHGYKVEINGKIVNLCVFSLCFTGDMPQQAENSGFKTSRATRGCRFCYISNTERQNLNYDLVHDGRYHHQTTCLRDEMNTLGTKAEKSKFGTVWGLKPEPANPPLVQISPALDLVLSRPAEPAHSEYGGIVNLSHFMFMEAILTKQAQKEYSATLRVFPFPPTYARLQGPIHHLNSYSLSDHARWSVIAPVLFRKWLRETHVQKHFVDAVQFLQKDLDTPQTVVEFVVSSYAAIAKSNSILMGSQISDEDRINMDLIVRECRERFQQLCRASSKSVNLNPRRIATPAPSRPTSGINTPSRAAKKPRAASQSARSAQLAQSAARSVSQSVDSVDSDNDTIIVEVPAPKKTPAIGDLLPGGGVHTEERAALKKMESQYVTDAGRPNVHNGLHYHEMMEEYGLPSNVNVLIGEDKHRWFKLIVYMTNHSKVEKTMLARENLQQTIRLLLLNAFQYSDPELTLTFSDMYKECPSLFRSILPPVEHETIATNNASSLEAEEDDELSLRSDHRHLRAAAINCIQKKYAKETLGLPIRQKHMSNEFQTQLRDAYAKDYNRPSIFDFGTAPIQWSKKLAFYDIATDRRITFACNDYIIYRDENVRRSKGKSVARTQMGRIDNIMVHSLVGVKHLFVALSDVEETGTMDAMLQLPNMRVSGKTRIVGLPAISARRIYIVEIDDAGDLVWVNWTLQFL